MTSEPGGPGRPCPTLRTDRLVLRAHTPDDHAKSFAMWSDPEVVRYMGAPLGREEVWRRILGYAGLWVILGHGYWLVEDAGARFVGEVGLSNFRRGLGPRFDTAPESGWVFRPQAHGQGYAAEAMSAALAWADVALGAPRTVCIIDPENAPSLKLAAKLGYAPYARQPYRGGPCVQLERPART